MKTQAKIIRDSIAPNGIRLTSLECVYPRIIHAEVMTHRVFSRNAASSRAIPVQKMIRMVQENPYVPSSWGTNQKGMQAGEDLDERDASKARDTWLHARDAAVSYAEKLLDVGVHKQLTNRLLEPFLWYTCLITATEWNNWATPLTTKEFRGNFCGWLQHRKLIVGEEDILGSRDLGC